MIEIAGVDHVLGPDGGVPDPGRDRVQRPSAMDGRRVLDVFQPVREDYRRLSGA